MGTVGSVVRVNHGYARHFLVPNRIAAVRRGKQSGSVGEKEAFNSSATSSSSSSSSASSANALSEEEKHKLRIDQQRRRLESAIKKLTSQTLVRPIIILFNIFHHIFSFFADPHYDY